MSAIVAASAIGAASSLAGAGISSAGTSRAAKRAESANKRLMALQQQYNVQNWNSENAYNDPSAVMERYRRAGLNPYSIIDNAGVGLAGSLDNPSNSFTPSPNDYNYSAPFGNALQNIGANLPSNLNIEQRTAHDKFNQDFEKALNDLNLELKHHEISNAQYNSDLALMERNYQMFTFSDKLLTTFLERDWRDRFLKNETAKLIQEGSALEDLLGLKMTENRGWQDENQDPTNFGPFFGRDESAPLVYRKATNQYYNFLYRGSKDKHNPIYQSFLNQYKNQYTRTILDSMEVSDANALRHNLNLARIIDSSNNLAEKQFEFTLRNGFKNADWNMLLFYGLKSLNGIGSKLFDSSLPYVTKSLFNREKVSDVLSKPIYEPIHFNFRLPKK